MADTKITALTAIGANPINVATFPIPMVDLLDNSMAASGTTKKVTVNQILGAGGTATLASATITGAASAAGLNVTGSTIPANGVYLGSANNLSFSAASTLGMTLNSTGLGVGTSPAAKVHVVGGAAQNPLILDSTGYNHCVLKVSGTNRGQFYADATNCFAVVNSAGSATPFVVTDTGNVGIGVAPSAWISSWKAIDISTAGAGLSGTAAITNLTNNCFLNASAQWIYKGSFVASRYQQSGGEHQFYTAASGTAGNAITFTQAMTLDASGRLLVGPTSANTSGGVLQLSSGITFPATQVASSDANTLDDYEEGTWTIVVNNQLGNSATIASQIARYVKIGRRVFVFGDFTLSAKGAAAAGNLVYLGNLPFVPNSTLFEGSVVHKYDNVNLTTNGQINIISAAGGNNVCFFPISSATTGTSNLTFGQITDTTRLVFNFSYDV